MEEDPFDIQQEAPKATLDILHRQLEEATKLEDAVEQMEEDLKNAKKHLNNLKAGAIPNTMNELQMQSVVWNGWKCSVSQFVSGSLPKEEVEKEIAVQWLVEHGGGNIIKTSISIDFPRSGHNEALDLAARLEGDGFPVLTKSGAHTQTLCAWAREKLKNGEELDTDKLGLFVGVVAKMDRVKK